MISVDGLRAALLALPAIPFEAEAMSDEDRAHYVRIVAFVVELEPSLPGGHDVDLSVVPQRVVDKLHRYSKRDPCWSGRFDGDRPAANYIKATANAVCIDLVRAWARRRKRRPSGPAGTGFGPSDSLNLEVCAERLSEFLDGGARAAAFSDWLFRSDARTNALRGLRELIEWRLREARTEEELVATYRESDEEPDTKVRNRMQQAHRRARIALSEFLDSLHRSWKRGRTFGDRRAGRSGDGLDRGRLVVYRTAIAATYERRPRRFPWGGVSLDHGLD